MPRVVPTAMHSGASQCKAVTRAPVSTAKIGTSSSRDHTVTELSAPPEANAGRPLQTPAAIESIRCAGPLAGRLRRTSPVAKSNTTSPPTSVAGQPPTAAATDRRFRTRSTFTRGPQNSRDQNAPNADVGRISGSTEPVRAARSERGRAHRSSSLSPGRRTGRGIPGGPSTGACAQHRPFRAVMPPSRSARAGRCALVP